MRGRPRAREQKPMDYALRVLSQRRMSCQAMRHRLATRGFAEEEVQACVGKLGEWGYLNDSEYAQDIVTTLKNESLVGRRRAKSELLKRSIDPELAQEVVDEAYGEDAEGPLALAAAKKYFRHKKDGSISEKERIRLARWLQRRGFGYEGIRAVLSTLGQDEP